MPLIRRVFAFSAVMLLSAQACAFSVLVQTTAKSAVGEPVGVHLQIVDMQTSQVLPGALKLPGRRAYHPLRVSARSRYGLVTVGPSRLAVPPTHNARSLAATFQSSPLRRIQNDLLFRDRAWTIRNAILFQGPSSADYVALLEESGESGGVRTGRLSLFRADLANGQFEEALGPWALPGIPVDAVAIPGRTVLAVLCEDLATGKAFLNVRDYATGMTLQESRDLRLGEGQFGSAPVALALADHGRRLVVLTTGYGTDLPAGQLSSWLNTLDSSTFEEPGAPLAIPGTAALINAPLQPGAAGSLWIATRTPGVDFAFATHVKVEEDSAEIIAQVPFTSVQRPLIISAKPGGHAVVVSLDDRVELWREGKPPGPSRTFPAPVGSLSWTARGILLGEGGRIHLLNFSLETLRSVQLQTGWVTAIRALPAPDSPDRDRDGLSAAEERARHTRADSPDTDDDGIPDGVDPEPARPSPRLELPANVTLSGEAAGAQEVTLSLRDPLARAWSVTYDRRAMNWLDVRTQESSLEGTRTTLRLDPARYTATENRWLSGTLTFHLRGAAPNTQAAGSPAQLQIDVSPSSRVAPRILWVWPARFDASGLRSSLSTQPYTKLAELLSAPPAHFSHHEIWGPIEDSLQPYDVVVLGMNAAIEGALTRHVVLDYVAKGGALLFIGAHAEQPSSDAIGRWLAPAGITIDASTRVDGVFEKSGSHEVARNWDRFRIRAGCLVRTDSDVNRLVVETGGDAGTILALRRYGFGRIAVLASASPLENAEISGHRHARFAQDLFRWLTSGRYSTLDRDGDNLPDYVEDANGNGVADAGETDLFNPDSDGDHIPDGYEDLNGNGRIDEGETNPRNPDSDGDGIGDAADVYPLPERGTPQITGIEPQSGPAEGGTDVEFTGLNFPPKLSIWFGDRRSKLVRRIDSTRLIAVTPPARPGESQALVDVRLVNRPRGLEASVPMGFQYAARSHVRLALDLLRVSRLRYQTYAGAVAIALDAPGVRIGDATFYIDVSPDDVIDRFNVIASPELRGMGREILLERVGPGSVRITLPQGPPLTGRLNLGTLQWSAHPKPGQERLTFNVQNAFVAERFGGTATVEALPLRFNLVLESQRRRR